MLANLKFFDIPTCTICQELLLQNLLILVDCGHTFHQQCIQPYLKQYHKKQCPNCRQKIKDAQIICFSIQEKNMQDFIRTLSNKNLEEIVIQKELILQSNIQLQSLNQKLENLNQNYKQEIIGLSTKVFDLEQTLQKYQLEISDSLKQIDELQFFYHILEQEKNSLQQQLDKYISGGKNYVYLNELNDIIQSANNDQYMQINQKPLHEQVTLYRDITIYQFNETQSLQNQNLMLQQENKKLFDKFQNFNQQFQILKQEHDQIKEDYTYLLHKDQVPFKQFYK